MTSRFSIAGRSSCNTTTSTTTGTTITTTSSTTWTGGTRGWRLRGLARRPGASARCAPTSRTPTPGPTGPARSRAYCTTSPQAPASTATTASPLSRGSIPGLDLTPFHSSFALTPSLDLASRTRSGLPAWPFCQCYRISLTWCIHRW